MSKDITVGVIGSGFAGLAAACVLAQDGFRVILWEKNDQTGGRARRLTANGYTFDMGPSWYWMPDVFEAFFRLFGKQTADFYTLKRLDPSYTVFWDQEQRLDVPADYDALKASFENIEKGSGKKLDAFLAEAEYKYRVGIHDLVYKPGKSLTEFANRRFLLGLFRLQVFNSMASHVRKFFKDERLIQLMEFPVLFLGALPKHIPALYSLMNYADIKLGTWYPEKGGMYRIVQAMTDLALSLGVEIKTSEPVKELVIEKDRVRRVLTEKGSYSVQGLIASADYQHVESALLPAKYRNYSEAYWQKRVLAPSSFIYYLGIEGEIPELHHHSLFFDAPFLPHAEAIYSRPSMPDEPLFYVSCPSRTDDSLAPAGHETLFILIPTAVDLDDSEAIRQKYYHIVMDRLEARIGKDIRSKVQFFKSYAHQDFKNDYHAFRGNAYGLANTLRQTAILKPSLFNKKVHNLLYAGQLTVPGPGVPPSLISGQVAAKEMKHYLENKG